VLRLLLSAGLLGLLTGGTLNASDEGATSGNAEGQLLLKIETPKTRFVLYEPIVVTYTVINASQDTIHATVNMDPDDGIRFSITAGDEPAQDDQPHEARCKLRVQSWVHPPGVVGTVSVYLKWTDATRDFASPNPGHYKLGARMSVVVADAKSWKESTLTLTAAPIDIDVTEPGPADAAAIRWLGSVEDLKRLTRDGAARYCGGPESGACAKRLDGFLQENIDSAYAPAVMFELASALAHDLINLPGHGMAIRLFETFLEKWPRHPMAPSAMFSMAMVFWDYGMSGGRKIVDRFAKAYPEKTQMLEQLQRMFPEPPPEGSSTRN
jgi:hypothetical protein